MRFFKIFLACFFSLIGVIGGSLGVMYVAGSFNQLSVEPTSIFFEEENYYEDGDFTIKILTPTENVTETLVTLTLENQIGGVVSGKITDGVITIPQKVYIGQSFTVEVLKGANEELGKDWIIGGISNITASSESDRAIDVNASVFIDVPVDSISIKTYSNFGTQDPLTTFALGESFYAEAIFSPANSKFKYSTTETKTVFFDISADTSGSIVENQEMITAMQEAGKPYIYGYDVVKSTNSIDIKTYCFQSAVIEDSYVSQPNITENELISVLNNTATGVKFTQDLIFTKRTVGVFSISNILTTNSLKFNTINKIYANNTSLANIGVQITGSDNTPLQNKIADVGLRAFVMEGGQARPATENELIFVNFTKTGFAENSGNSGAYFLDAETGEYLAVDSEATYEKTYDKYYFPKVVASNVDNSYWSVVPISSGLSPFFKAYLFENGDTIDIAEADRTLETPQWQATTATTSTLNWKTETDVDLIFIDSNLSANQKIAEYDLSGNLQLSNTQATYTSIKYLAYSADYNISTFIQNATLTTKYDLSDYGITQTLYEIGSLLSANQAGVANIVAVIIKTDYLGRPIETNEMYEIMEISTSISGLEDYKSLTINVEKTIQNISASLQVDSLESLKNTSKAIDNVLSNLAFVENQSTSVFKVYLTLTASDTTTIAKEKQLFIDAWNNGEIYFKAYKTGDIESAALTFSSSYQIVSETTSEWIISFDAFTTVCETDTELTIKYFYEKTPTTTSSEYISSVNFGGELSEYSYNASINAVVEVYDGKVSRVEFGVETTSENSIEKAYTITKGESFEDGLVTKFYASDVDVTYSNGETNITSQIINQENGTYLLTFYDKYDNEMTLPATDFELSSVNGNIVALVSNYSSSLYDEGQPTATLYITETQVGEIQSVEYNQGEASEEGVFNAKFVSITPTQATSTILKIQRYGAKNSVINLTGINGLLNIEFEDANNEIFELCNIINYTILTSDWNNVYTDWQTTFNGVLSLNESGSSITVLKSVNSDIKINLSATTGLGETILIELTIVPNISAEYSLTTTQTGANDITNAYTYKGIYSENNVEISIEYTLHLLENFSLTCPADENGNTFIFVGNSKTISFTNTLSATATLIVNFGIDSLGTNTVFIKTGTTDFDFKQPIYLNINANLQLANAEDNTINLPVEIASLNTDNQVLSSDDLERIIGTTEIDLEKVSLEFATAVLGVNEYNKIYSIDQNGNEVLCTQNIFAINGFNIQATAVLTSNYKITLNVYYGEAKIGSIVLSVASNITPDSTAENFAEYFTNYNGKQHLVLTAGTEYAYADIFALFTNISSISFDTPANSAIYSLNNIGENTITVSTIKAYTPIYCLHLVSDIGNLTYPVLFSPLEIGYVQYDETTAENPTETAEANNDIAKLNSTENILLNNIYDIYDSGKYTSLLKTNYTISLTDTTYTFKNYTNEALYILARTNGGYYYKQIASISSSNSNYVFDLTTIPSGWVQITDESIIATEFLATETTFIGAFSSVDEITNTNQIPQERGYGFSLELYEKLKSGLISINIYDEITGGYSTTKSTYATFDVNNFLLQPQIDFSTIDRTVWVVITDKTTGTVIAKYRIEIEKNSMLNVYYPYGTGVGSSIVIGNETEQAEYVYLNGQDYVINFNNSLNVEYPNSIRNLLTYRVMLQRGSDLTGWQTATNASIVYSPYMISIGEVDNDNIETFSDHLSFANNVLTIIGTNQIFVIYMKANAQIDGQDIGTEIIYKIYVNYGLNNFELLETENNNEKYEATTELIANGGAYDFSDYVLYNNSTPANILNYYIYTTENKNLADYVTLDLTAKTLSIKDGVDIVSDLKLHFVYYTIYGEVLNTEITFASSIVPKFNDSQTTLTIAGDNSYEVFADVPFNLTSIFEIVNDGISTSATSEYWEYSLDNGLTYISGDSLKFTQNQVGNFVVKVIVKLTELNSTLYLEDYTFEFNLQVKQSLKANYAVNAYNLNTNGIVFSVLPQEVSNKIFVSNITTTTGYLFSVQNTDILSQYGLTVGVQDGNAFVSISSFDLVANTFTLTFTACPADTTLITIWFKLTKTIGGFNITSYLTFSLIPDVAPLSNYPEADSGSDEIYTFEAVYLDSEYINHSKQSTDWSSVGSDYEIISLSGYGVFGEKRLKFYDNDGNEIIDTTKLNEIAGRIKIVVSAINTNYGNLVIAYNNGESLILNRDINLEQAVGFASNLYVKWVGTSEILQNQTGDITFTIYIDNIERADYTIKFYSNAQQIFTTSVNAFNNTETIDSTPTEIFYVLDANTEKIFSNQTAKLAMTFKTGALSSTATTLTAYVNSKILANKVGEISVNNSTATINWILTGVAPISLDNLIITIGETDYLFNKPTNTNSIFKTYIQQDSCTLTNRLSINYLGKKLSYTNYANYVFVGANKAENQTIYKGNPSAIDVKNTVNFSVGGEVIGSYYYTLKYDFNINEEKEFNSYIPQFTVGGDNINLFKINLFDEYDITHYNGSEYTGEYFVNTNVAINAYVILITNSDFETNQISANVKYYNSAQSAYCNEIKAGLTSTNTTWIDYISIIYDQEKNDQNIMKTKRIFLTLNGAENNGNYVYILVTYEANNVSADKAYAIVKLKISSNWEYSAISDLSSPYQNLESTNPLRVYYASVGVINNITLIGSSINYINLYRTGPSENLALGGGFTFTIVGDITNFLILEKTTTSLTLKKGTQTAEYGNKTGYILITDKYGYTQKYYIELVAPAENALALTDQIINSVNDVYESSSLSIVDSTYDTETNGAILTNYAFKVSNLNALTDNGYTYTVSYIIEDLGIVSENHDSGDQSTYNTGYIPAQSFYANGSSITVNLKIVLHITNGVSTETITFNRSLTILKRFETTGTSGVVVRDGQTFNVADYINISDNNAEENLGSISLSTKIYTLVVDESYLNQTLTLNILSGGQNYAYTDFIVGKNYNNVVMTATNGKYYYPLSLFNEFVGIADYTIYTYSIYGTGISQTLANPTDTVPTTESVYLIKDKCLSIVTSNNNPSSYISVALNNGPYKVLIPFCLNFDGKQSVSVYESITNLTSTEPPISTLLQTIHNYELDSTPISTADLQLLKGISIYNETLTLKIASGMLGKNYNVKVYYDGENFKETGNIQIQYNYAHYVYISLYNILGQDLGLNEQGAYKIEVIYAISNIASGTQTQYATKIQVDGYLEINPIPTTQTNVYIYTITINEFLIQELEINTTSQMFEDNISILNAQDFVGVEKINVNKYYLVKYIKDNVVYAVSVNYTVTPKYHTVDDNGNTAGDTKKIVYANQYTLLYNSAEQYYYYKIDFDVWSNAYNLLDKYGNVLTTVKDAKNDLVFMLTGDGLGSATLDENNTIITSSAFTEQQMLSIAVYVKVYENETTYTTVLIDTINISISLNTLYVPVAGNYNIIISTEIAGRIYSINIQHEFLSTTETISNLIATNANIAPLVNVSGKIGFATADTMTFVPASKCDFSVVNVINDIYSAEYDGSKLNIKINLDETQNSIGKVISLKTLARGIVNTNQTYLSKIFDLTVGYNTTDNYYTLTASTGTGEDLEVLGTFTKISGYYTISLNLADIFTTTFVGTDYSYTVNIEEISSSDTLSIVYSNDIVPDNIPFGQTLFFHIAYTDSSNHSYSKILGLQYTIANQNYSGSYGYALDVSSLLLVGIINYTVSYLGGYDLACENATPYNLLVSIVGSSINTNYGIAYVEGYSDSAIFEVIDYANLMNYLPQNNLNSIMLYTNTVIETPNGTVGTKLTPTIIKLSSTATPNTTYYYGVYGNNVGDMQIFGLSSSTTDLYIDVSAFSAYAKITIKNCNGIVNLSGEILPLFESASEAVTYWQSKTSTTTILYTKTNITKTTFASGDATITMLDFDITPGLVGTSFTSSVLKTANTNIVDLTAISGEVVSTYTYTFELFQNTTSLGNIEINGDMLTAVNLVDILTGLELNFDNGNYTFTYISFDDNIPEE